VNPQCCPSRSTFLTGRYSHNTGVMDNQPRPHGGWSAFRDDEPDTIATWLDRAGYHSGYIGKYLNGYEGAAPRRVPPGWDKWRDPVSGMYRYDGTATYNVDGTLTARTGYQDAIRTRMATTFLRNRSQAPMFLTVSYLAPHGSPQPGRGFTHPVPRPRHAHAYDGMRRPHNPAVDNPTGDRPRVVRDGALTHREHLRIRRSTERRREALLAVDDGVRRIVATLRRTGELASTYIVFTSDNGYFAGEHRVASGKARHDRPSSTVPLVASGPDVAAGATRDQLTGLHDLAPTFLDWTGTSRPARSAPVDGVSLAPSAAGATSMERDVLIESREPELPWKSYRAIRTSDGWK